ncbi:unnamed protein product [Linum tenue]|uniref:Uncharacterized protein n=1 Tax=Linum tenue TaxID=586396 RepID=A0AAV0GXW7_9ROSI|nr:unnamed protein product [Linum tenue]
MGNQASCKKPSNLSTELSSYEAACAIDEELRSFDTKLQARTNHVINTVAADVEVRALSLDSLKEVIGCLLDVNQEVVKVILDCKKDIWKSHELFKLVEDYFDNSLHTLDFCAALEKSLKRARDNQLLLLVALQQFDEEELSKSEFGSGPKVSYKRTMEELRNFKEAGNPFTEEFYVRFHMAYKHQIEMMEKLRSKKGKLDKKLKSIHSWRKLSSIIFVASFATVLICSVVAAAIAAPPVATAALAAATSVPLGSMGKWIDSLWRNYESTVKGQRELVGTMQLGSYVAIKDLETIRVTLDRLEVEMVAVEKAAEFVSTEEEGGEAAVKIGMEEIRKKLDGFMRNVEELEIQVGVCSKDIRQARTVVLQLVIK